MHLGVGAAVLLRVSVAGNLRGCVPGHLEVDVAEAPIGQHGWTRGEQVDAHPRLLSWAAAVIKVNWGSGLEVRECGSVHVLQECNRCFQEEVRVGAAKAGAQRFIVGTLPARNTVSPSRLLDQNTHPNKVPSESCVHQMPVSMH